MNMKKFNFTDENFGEEVECVLIWDDNSFILISVFENRIAIKKYKEITELIKEMITNKHELEINKEFLVDQDMQLIELEKEIKILKTKLLDTKLKKGEKINEFIN